MRRPSVSISNRFIALTIVGYLLAVGAAAVAVSLGSSSILKGLQDETIQDTAEGYAQAVRIALREFALKASLLARNKDVIKLAVGDDVDVGRAIDSIQEASFRDLLSSVYIIDFEGNTVLEQSFRAHRSDRFLGYERLKIASVILSGIGPEFAFSVRPGSGSEGHHFLIAQPIRQNNLIEGVLIAEVAMDVATIINKNLGVGTAEIATDFQFRMLDEWSSGSEAFAAPVDGTDFYVVLRPNRQAVAAAGDAIVSSVLNALGFFLFIPFGLMSFVGYRAIVEPHRELEDSQKELRENQKKLSELADIAQRSNDAIIATDIEGRITWANQAFQKTTGYALDDVMGMFPGAFLQGPDTDPDERNRIGAALRNRQAIRSEILNYTKDGTPYWNSLSIAPQFDGDGNPYRFVAIASDITEKRLAQNEVLRAKAAIEHQANHDALTGLPNRRALDCALEKLKREDTDRVLIRIDLDYFKNVNDTLGHAAGDHVLMIVSQKLKEHTREADMAARVGGDEFVILMGDKATQEEAELLAERLLSEIQKEIVFEDKNCRVGASFGVAASESGLLENSELLIGADAALYVAKESGRNRVVSYTEVLHQEVVAGRNVATEIEAALSRNEFEPFFQPQFDAQTFEFKGMEALARWRHPTRGLLAPGEFLSIAEQLSVTDKIDAIVLKEGLKTTESLIQAGLQIPKVSFNVAANRLEYPDIPELAHLLALEGTTVSFEILESVLVEDQSELFRSHVELLRDMGFGVEVDDFGSGHASIIGLTQLSADAMKIDQRLISPIADSLPAQAIVRAIVEIGRALGISITAEGVETVAHARLLADVGCDTLQGFLFAEPMSATDLMQFLSNYDAKAFKAHCMSELPARAAS